MPQLHYGVRALIDNDESITRFQDELAELGKVFVGEKLHLIPPLGLSSILSPRLKLTSERQQSMST